MTPLNQHSEMSSNNSSVNSSADAGAGPIGQDTTSNVQQGYQPRPSAVERRQQQQRKGVQQSDDDEPRRFSLAELFSDDNDSDDLDSDGNDDLSKPPESFEVLSKRLGLKPEQLYNVKVSMPNGAEALTIGQLKDRVGEVVDLETRETQFEQYRMQKEGETLRSQAEIREILSMIPKEHVKPEVVEKIRKRHEANLAIERRMTLEHIPEWRDEKRRGEDLQGMVEFMSTYGFDQTFLGTVTDHRAIKFIRDMFLRDRRIKRALADVKTADSRGQRASGKTKNPPRNPVKQASNTTRRSGAVPTHQARIAALFNKSE